MRRPWLLLFILIAFSRTGAGAADDAKIIALGASFTAGKGVASSETFTARLQGLLHAHGYRVQVVNQGADGDTTADLMKRLATAVPDGTAGVILAYDRANDEKAGLSKEQTVKNIETIVDELLGRQIHVLLVVRGRDSAEAQARLAQFRDFAADRDLPMMPLEQPPSMLAGAAHATASEYSNIAARMLAPVESLLMTAGVER
jgi:acyl-CoA thioesterase-1